MLIWLHSILRTYRDTFRNSTDVPTMYRLCCDLHYKPHFALFSCDFLTIGLTHWSRAQIYQLNDYMSQKLDSTHSLASTTCTRELRTFCDFVPFCDFCAFLWFQSFHILEACCQHQVHGSLKNINPGTSNIEIEWSDFIFNLPLCIGYIIEE